MKTTAILAAALAATTVGLASVPALADRVDQRQYNQEHRIQDGLRSGQLTRSEYLRLEAEQARIREMERAAKRDGYVDRYERHRLEEAQDRASRHIRSEKTDSDTRGSGHGHGHHGPRGWGWWR